MKNIDRQQYIDTLYLSWRFEDLALVSNYETQFFRNYGAEYLGTANGYNWFNCPIGRCGIIEKPENIFRAGMYAFVIQYENRYLLENTIDNLRGVLDLDTLVFPKDEAIVKRIDFSIITNETGFFDCDVISHFRSRTDFSRNDVLETVYLGKRANGKVFRYYRKDIELKQDKNLVKEDYFMQMFTKIDFSLPVTVLEMELHRKFLRTNYGFAYLKDIDTLLNIVYAQFVDIRFYIPTEKNLQHLQNRRRDFMEFQYIGTLDIEEVFEVERVVSRYSPSLSLLYSRVNKIVTSFCDKSGLKISKTELLLNIFDEDIELERLSGQNYSKLRERYEREDLFLLKLL